MLNFFTDEYFMKEALKEAQQAFKKDEIPIGAVIVYNNKIIARGHNLTETLQDPTAHAEMQVITSATNYIGSKYLTDCSIYVTLEPCIMCAGALAWSQISKIVYAASDPKKGFTIVNSRILHPKTEIINGILEKECSLILNVFFKKLRNN